MTAGVNDGQRQLVESGLSLGAVAKRIGSSRTAVRKWKLGQSIPVDKLRHALRDELGIGLEAWDVALPPGYEIKDPPPVKMGRPRKGATPAKPATPKASPVTREPRAAAYPEPPGPTAGIVENLRYSLTCIRHDLMFGDLTTSARSKLRSDEARTLGLIAKLRREEEMSEDRYVREHPAFVAHCEAVLTALESCPDCLVRVAEALRA